MLKKITSHLFVSLCISTGLCSVLAMEPNDQSNPIHGTPLKNKIPLNAIIIDKDQLLSNYSHKRKINSSDDSNPTHFKKQCVEKNTHDLKQKEHEAVRDNPQTTPADRERAQLALAVMDGNGYGTVDGKPDFLTARKGCEAVRDNLETTPADRVEAQLGLAVMDRNGYGTVDGKPNFLTARKGFEAVRDNLETTPADRERAQLTLDTMD